MPENSTQLVINALGRAVADPTGLPLHGGKNTPGLFAANATGKQAAQRCKNEGFLSVVRAEPKGRSTTEICAITEKGLAFLLAQASPKQVLEDFIRVLEGRQTQVDQLLHTARDMQGSLDALKTAAEKVLRQVHQPTPTANHSSNGSEAWTADVLSFLARRQESGATDDCPLPELYQQARLSAPRLSIGQLHDGLRKLYEQQQIYLHPWTGPLYELPEPPYALLVGHEIAYYASIRQ